MKEIPACKNCLNFINKKPNPYCKASKSVDPVTGFEKRECRIERLDGIGYCGSLANNYKQDTAKK